MSAILKSWRALYSPLNSIKATVSTQSAVATSVGFRWIDEPKVSNFTQSRFVSRIPFVDGFLMKMKQNNKSINNKKIWSRRSTILPEFVNTTVRIYNGKTFVRCKITEGKVGHKFGEFAMTRKRRKIAPANTKQGKKKTGKK
ncbi:hypothetical protein K2173_005186 [Erythroxylum novogranatense]|uniref:Ribosomal protein S19 n=1 Tax=Erythroxylum novogranatense TaxID=1862640 RepID=A0AAV8TTS0_9ROSI|nr:hypothetical protein K2173_005186 [Erythroxylum novogranatense]